MKFLSLRPAVGAVFLTLACACSKKDAPSDKPKAEVSEVVEPTASVSANATAPVPTATASANVADASPGDASVAASLETYSLTPANAKIAFTGSKVGGSHNGSFSKFTGTLSLSPSAIDQSKLDFEVDTASLHTDAAKLDAHLKSADFFDVEKYPKARFKATSIKPTEAKGATHLLTGVMEIRGIKKNLTFPIQVTVKDDTVTAKADFVINRKSFKIDFDGAADYLIKDDVPLSISINVPRKK